MPELDGFGVLEALGTGPMPVIVFVTAFDRFAVKAFEVHAVDYLLKPSTANGFKRRWAAPSNRSKTATPRSSSDSQPCWPNCRRPK